MDTNSPAYVFHETTHARELERLRSLEAIFDEGTRRALLAAGLKSGSQCLEIGAGAGSIAKWMGRAAAPTGRVMAVDIDTRFLAEVAGGNIEVRETDIRRADLAAAEYDLAHARFVLIHMSDWSTALDAALRSLKPGGRLVLEEPDFSAARSLSGPPDLRQAFDQVHRAIAAMFSARDMDFAFGLQLPSILLERGLGKLTVENYAPVVPGASPIARMMAMSTCQLRDKYLATGLATNGDIERYRSFSAAPACWAIYHGTIRITATKPQAGDPSG